MSGHENKDINKKAWRFTKGDPSSLFRRIETGAKLEDIANDIGCTPQAIHQYLLRVDETAYKNAREIAADYLYTGLVGVAADKDIEPARARNMINVGTFGLERRYSQTFGRKDKLEVTGQVDIVSRLHAARKRMNESAIDAEAIESQG